MREMCEFRVVEQFADRLFAPDEGVRLGDHVVGYDTRRVELSTSDPRFRQVALIDEELRRRYNRRFFHGWDLRRQYTKNEIKAADLFCLNIRAVFEPDAKACGTQFDYSDTCPICSAGRRQVSDMISDLRKIPRQKHIARTITADEWIVSQRLAELMLDANLTGFEFGSVRHKAHYVDDPIDFKAVPSGKELLRLAEEAGYPYGTWQFYCWLNRKEQSMLSRQMTEEWIAMRSERSQRLRKPYPAWYQLIITSRRVPTVPPTRFGNNPFDDDVAGRYRCLHDNLTHEKAHVSGLNLLSEVFVRSEDYDGSDLVCTKDYVGGFKDWFTPGQILLISPQFRSLLIENEIRGWSADVSYLT